MLVLLKHLHTRERAAPLWAQNISHKVWRSLTNGSPPVLVLPMVSTCWGQHSKYDAAVLRQSCHRDLTEAMVLSEGYIHQRKELENP